MGRYNEDTETDSLDRSVNAETPSLAPDLENVDDEADILMDQDETDVDPDAEALRASARDEDASMGGDGSPESFGVGGGDYARGEVDLKEQMDRTIARQDAVVHRPRDPDISPYSGEGKIDRAEAIHNGMLHRDPRDGEPLHKSHGEPTGAFTDVGAGRSGVTRHH